MKRLLAVVLAVAAVVCVFLLPTSAEETHPQAGFGKVDITPDHTVSNKLPLGGYDMPDRYMTGVETLDEAQSRLYTTCIALTDMQGTTALFISVDSVNSNQQWTNDAKMAIVAALKEENLDADRIYISATGTMSAPEMVYTGTDEEVAQQVKAYRQMVVAKTVEAAQAAMADRCDVQIEHNDMSASEAVTHLDATAAGTNRVRMNYSAHYNVVKTSDPTVSYVAGSSFGPSSYINNNNYTVTEVFKPDDTMGLLKLVPADGEKPPIVLANWSAKANLSSTGYFRYGVVNRNMASADYVGFFRTALDAKGYRTAFFQGTSGNVSAFPMLLSQLDEDVVVTDYPWSDEEGNPQVATIVSPKLYGEKLAQLAHHGLTHKVTDSSDHLHEAISSAPIRNMKVRFALEPNVPTQEQIDLVNKLRAPETALTVEEVEYQSLYDYITASQKNFTAGKTQVTEENGFTAEQVALVSEFVDYQQLTGIYARMRHRLNYVTDEDDNEVLSSVSFATNAVYCDVTMLQFGKMTFVMAPAELYDFYGEQGGEKDWEHVGAHFVLGNTNGASGYMPNAASFDYNRNKSGYYQGTNITQSTVFPRGAGERLMETYINVKKTMDAQQNGTDLRFQCECGAKAEEFTSKTLAGHDHELKEFIPWYDPDSFPVDGNYYLMTDVRLCQEARTGIGRKCIDLNGHTITRKVLPEIILDEYGPQVEDASMFYKATRLFAVESNARITITDTVGGGKLTRNIDALNAVSPQEQKKIENYGLLVAIINGNVNHHVLYAGELDAVGQYTGGGACVANMSPKATFTMYDGEMKGGVSDHGAAMYANGTNYFYGGTVNGGVVADTASDDNTVAEKSGLVDVAGDGKLHLAGNASVLDENNNGISVNKNCLTVAADYEGSAGITVRGIDDPNGFTIGTQNDVTDQVLAATLTADYGNGYSITTCEGRIIVAQLRQQCECGGKAAGKTDHECKVVTFKPWPEDLRNYLPSSSVGGNYYLLSDVTLNSQKSIAAEFCIDLNGHTITRVVKPKAEEDPDQTWFTNTRVFYIGNTEIEPYEGRLAITDTVGTGKICRDLSAVDEDKAATIDDYGIVMLVSQFAGGDCALYGGTLVGSDQVSGGGVVANLSETATFSMYGGEIAGCNSKNAAGIYTAGQVKLFGGTISGGKGVDNGVGGVKAVKLSNPERTGSLIVGGDVNITGNVNVNNTSSNILPYSGYQTITVKGPYTGTAGMILNGQPYDGMKVARSDNANIDNATFTADNYPGVKFRVDGDYIVVDLSGLAAYVTYEDQTPVSYHTTLQEAFNACPGGKANVTMVNSVNEGALSVERDTFLNLAGCNVANTTFEKGENKLYVLDTKTDDYSVADGVYGKLTGAIAEAAQGVEIDTELAGLAGKRDDYLKVKEDVGVSFHRLNLRMVNIVVQSDSYGDESYCPGQYYKAQFGGDEKVKANITHYGVGMAVLKEPTFENPLSYTAFDAASWQCGKDAAGDSLNLAGSSQLTGILKPTNTYSINSRNAHYQIYGQAYVRLADGTTLVKGPAVNYSFREMLQGREDFDGVDNMWETLEEVKKTAAVRMFNQFSQLMCGWDIPNIIKAAGYVRPTPVE